ncbi:MAG: hypothetical protein JWN63_136 [Candidatus Acidoferrum typicum]|nr:hypothetical protein [Candidatus Acidoferrum typicum]
MTEEHTAEKIARLEREIEVLKKENERLRQLLEEALRAASDKRPPSRDKNPKPSPKNPDAKQESSMGAVIAGPSPTRLMKLSKYRCRPVVRDAEGSWRSARPFLSSKPRFRSRGWSALSFAFLWGTAGVADGECRGDIHGKPRMP